VSRISRKNQITVPVKALEDAGLHAGDDVTVRAVGPGRLEVVRLRDLIDEFAGTFDGVYPRDTSRSSAPSGGRRLRR
jgi:bifunctional DNA-binding transcriptional regulator/antitoxin component of YhaV-PrlF toxin-antitoxin module